VTYEVRIAPRAFKSLRRSARWWAKHRSPSQALRWYEGFVTAINSLAENPERRPLARENNDLPVEARDLTYGLGRRPTHRAVFIVRPNVVVVIAVRHLAQRNLRLEDI
jgi:plasmid stabilization system protein ParE